MERNTAKNQSGRIVKVAIVGGGCAALAAAWQLSKLPHYEVHVYEKSWRLGGKGASGRTPEGRVEEHGLHVWLGFYENAFRIMRDCYAEVAQRKWGPEAKQADQRLAHASIDDAFRPEPHIGVGLPQVGSNAIGKWAVWSGLLPPAKGLPGEPLVEGSNPFTLGNYLLRCVELVKTLMLSVIGPADTAQPGDPRPDQRSKLDEALDQDFDHNPLKTPEALVDTMTRYLRTGVLSSASGLLQAVRMLEIWLHKTNLSLQVSATPLCFLEALAAQTRKQLSDLVEIDPALRRKMEIIDIVMTIAVGLYRDRVLFSDRGFDAINHIDYRKWLEQHGATKTALASRFLTGIYDLTFAYRQGEHTQPELAAGVALRGALRMFFTYRGAMFWRMRSGMGDAVFAPLYKVLQLPDRQVPGDDARATPVRFHFLHELRKVEFDSLDGKCYVKALEFQIRGDQARLDEASARALDSFGCWPNGPRVIDEILGSSKDTEAINTLQVGEHFDAVILATGFDDFVRVSKDSEFFDRVPAYWREMCSSIQTVATQSAQVWMRRDLEELGWQRGTGIFTALQPPFETWADMTHILPTERAWRRANSFPPCPADGARSLAYFCGVLSQKEVEGLEENFESVKALVGKNLDALLDQGIRSFWPEAFRESETARQYQIERYVVGNFQPADRYTQSLPGTIEQRVSPLDPSVANMTVAGDWTACGLDAGCVESAVMSGMLAAFAISNDAHMLNAIVGYDHP